MKYTRTVLKNGLRVLTIPMTGSQTAITMVMVEAGSEYEDKKTNGLSHFLEHMCFKGTKNRTGIQLTEEIDSLGAENNAFTGETYTGYYAKAHYKKIHKITEIISDLYLNPTFPERDIDIERGVILEEINMYEDMPMRKVQEVFTELLFPNQPAGRTILGSKNNIKKFKQSDFLKYYKKHYIPQKTVVVVAGNINEKEILSQIYSSFGNLKKTASTSESKKPKTIIKQKKPILKIHHKESDQTHIILGFRSYTLNDKKNYPLAIAQSILSGGLSSRLFKKMRDELGMCYYVRANNFPSIDHGEFIIRIGVGNDRAHEAVGVLIDEMKKIRDEKVSDVELQKAKDMAIGSLANSLETSDAWAGFYAEQELFHQKIKTPEEVAEKIRSVTSKQVQKVMNEIITNQALSLAIVGPQKDEKSFRKILSV